VIANDFLSDIRAVVFDAVGTLIYPRPTAAEIYAEVGRRFGSRRKQEEIAERFGLAFQKEEAVDRVAGFRTSEERERLRWRRIVTEVLDDVSDSEACFQTLFQHFSRPQAWRCDQDAASTVQALARSGYLLGIATNYDHRLRSVVAGLTELSPIQNLVISSEVGWRKPAPQFFAAVSEVHQLPSQRILHVGDDALNDYEAARAAGMPAVLFSSKDAAEVEPRRQIRRLSELVESR